MLSLTPFGYHPGGTWSVYARDRGMLSGSLRLILGRTTTRLVHGMLVYLDTGADNDTGKPIRSRLAVAILGPQLSQTLCH